jgi:hypothetical protein
MSWNYSTDPLYRWLLAESADLEWQCVEDEFQTDLKSADAGEISAIEPATSVVSALMRTKS